MNNACVRKTALHTTLAGESRRGTADQYQSCDGAKIAASATMVFLSSFPSLAENVLSAAGKRISAF